MIFLPKKCLRNFVWYQFGFEIQVHKEYYLSKARISKAGGVDVLGTG